MAYLKRIIVVIMLMLPLSLPAQAEPVLGHISGFPVYPGLSEVEDAGLIFDKAEGRVIEAQLRGEGDADEARVFYQVALQQTGWRRVMIPCGGNHLVYVREGELLEMAIAEVGGVLEIGVYLAPNDSGL